MLYISRGLPRNYRFCRLPIVNILHNERTDGNDENSKDLRQYDLLR